MKMITLLSVLALTLTQAYASYDQAPPSFNYSGDQAVYVDFKSAHYQITYDYSAKTATVVSSIEFNAKEDGYPLFDLVAEPSEVILDQATVITAAIKDPDQSTTFRVIKEKVSKGLHRLHVEHTFSTNVVFASEGVASGFWMSDLTDRRYLEQYLPTNMEFDQYKMELHVLIVNAPGEHVLKANGKVSKHSSNMFSVSYPEFYSTSSIYFHLYPAKNAFNNAAFYYKSIDGRLIPVDIYTTYDVNEFVTRTKEVLAELEADYAPFPHDQVVIYGNAPSGGMEHAGATATSLKALGHELFHCYHARALMPANGNAGWMDEAIARWRDNNYPLLSRLTFESTRLAGRSVWARMTDRMAYTEGSAFLSWIAFRMNQKGLSFKGFLRDYFEKYKYTTVTTPLFQKEMEAAACMDLKADFDKYIYGVGLTEMKLTSLDHVVHEQNPSHPKLTKEQLIQLTWPQ